jgi:hypothetical protein
MSIIKLVRGGQCYYFDTIAQEISEKKIVDFDSNYNL